MKAKGLFSKEHGRVPDNTPLNDQFISLAVLKGVIVGVLAHIGFSKTYIHFFPTFDGFTTAQHFHGMMMMPCLLMLLVQPCSC